MKKIDLNLGLSRCVFLKAGEKSLLSKKLDNLESLTVLSIEEISYLTGRSIGTTSWKPDSLIAEVDRDIVLMNLLGMNLATIDSPEYPPLLREIHDPPFSLFWRGTLPDPEKPLVAIVGTRGPSGDGVVSASRIAKEFAEAGIPVVSGLARGIDAFAHKGCIDGGGRTIAVLPCGLDRMYPASNKILAGRILDNDGCLLSEYSPGEPPLKYRFPQRNRIISGLSRSVIVIEAPEKSGALITADFALDQGRDLFVGKDALHSARSAGTRLLQSQGAPSVHTAREVAASWGCCTTFAKATVEPDSTSPASARDAGRQLASEFRKQLALDFKS